MLQNFCVPKPQVWCQSYVPQTSCHRLSDTKQHTLCSLCSSASGHSAAGHPRSRSHKAAAKALLGLAPIWRPDRGRSRLQAPSGCWQKAFPRSCRFHSIFSNAAAERGHCLKALIYRRLGPSFLLFFFIVFYNYYFGITCQAFAGRLAPARCSSPEASDVVVVR